MIKLTASGYTLRQVKGERVTYVTFPDHRVRQVIGPELTEATKTRIIIAAGRRTDLTEDEKKRLEDDRFQSCVDDWRSEQKYDRLEKEKRERGD